MKFKIGIIYLLASHILIFAFIMFTKKFWYPFSLSEVTGFNDAAKALVIVNLVLSLLLFFFLLKKNPKHKKSNLIFLLLIQISAFIFGINAIFDKHPVYAVFAIDRFTLVNNKNTEPEKILFEELKSSFMKKTTLAFAKSPENIKAKNELIFSVLSGKGKDIDKRHEYFEPYNSHIDSVKYKSIDTKKLFSTNEALIKLQSFLNEYSGSVDDYLYLPLQSASKDVVWVLDKENALPIGIIDIDPWLYL